MRNARVHIPVIDVANRPVVPKINPLIDSAMIPLILNFLILSRRRNLLFKQEDSLSLSFLDEFLLILVV